MIDTETPEGQWFEHLATQLHDRRIGRWQGRRWSRESSSTRRTRPGLELLADYQHGDPPLSNVHKGWRPYVRQFVRMGRLNVAGLLVSSTRNRMSLRDFRTAAAADEYGDQQARDVMRANNLSLLARDVHGHVLGLGDAYTITEPPSGGSRWSTITAEDPRQVITSNDPRTGRPRAGLKMFRDDWDSADIAYLYLEDGLVRRAIRKGATSINDAPFRMGTGWGPGSWEWDDAGDQRTPGGLFPVVQFRNCDGIGEFEEHLDTLDRINDKIFNEWWIAKIQAFRQRAVKNLPDTETKLVDGKAVEVEVDYTDMFTASPDEMWQVPGDVEFWESTPVDLTPITTSIQKDLERLAAVASQPLHTITPDAANGSAEGAALMREEHLYKVEDRVDRMTPKWAETMALAFYFMGDTERADVSRIEPIWGPKERYSLQEKANAASQLRGLLPSEAIQTDVLQYAPAHIPELRAMRGRDLIFTQPAPPAPQPAVEPATPVRP